MDEIMKWGDWGLASRVATCRTAAEQENGMLYRTRKTGASWLTRLLWERGEVQYILILGEDSEVRTVFACRDWKRHW